MVFLVLHTTSGIPTNGRMRITFSSGGAASGRHGPVLVKLAAIMMIAFGDASAESYVTLYHQGAPSPAGPWTTIDANAVARNVDGNPVLSTAPGQQFFRSLIVGGGTPIELATGPRAILVSDAPETAVRVATDFFARMKQMDELVDVAGGRWKDAELASYAYPVYDPAILGGTEPAFLEFKVIGPSQEVWSPSRTWGRTGTRMRPPVGMGYILVSLTEETVPVPECSTSGPTEFESLAADLGIGDFKAVRFGPAFVVAENDAGAMLGSFGTEPVDYEIPAGEQNYGREVARSSEDPFVLTPPPTSIEPRALESYAAFKEAWRTSEYFAAHRRKKAASARLEWDKRDGNLSSALELSGARQERILGDRKISSFALKYEGGNDPILVSLPTDGSNGLIVTTVGTSVADIVLSVEWELDGSVFHEDLLLVIDPAPEPPMENCHLISDSGGVMTWVCSDGVKACILTEGPSKKTRVCTYTIPGGLDGTPGHWQYRNDDLCPLSGCGPTAWTMMYAWWDHHGATNAYFYDGVADANLFQNDSVVEWNQTALHELCDVWCFLTTDQGATMPWDMYQGLELMASRNVGWAYEDYGSIFSDYDASLIAMKALKAGRPAIVGYHEDTHYALAYSMLEFTNEVEAGGATTTTSSSYLVVNLGFGWSVDEETKAPIEIKHKVVFFDDVFYACDLRMWDK